MREAEARRLLDETLELLHRADSVLPARLEAMWTAQNGWPASANLDPTQRGGGVHWCWEHERGVFECHRIGLACDGEVVASPGDPTGELAAGPSDTAAADLAALARSLRALHVEAGRAVSLLARYGTRPATAEERRSTLRNGERPTAAFECWCCARIDDNDGNPWFQPAARRVTLRDGEPRLLCEWCRAWLRDVGELPTLRQLEERRRGGRVRKPERAS